jgi:cytochrome c oxidase assembly protein subunit 15
VSAPAYRRGLHAYAVAVAAATFCLLFVGGLVTSTGSALAVPTWPLDSGTLFPRMTGGVLFEMGHRLVAGTLGLMTVGLAVWVWLGETRRWVRVLGITGAVTIVLQAVLGGLTVLLRLPLAMAIAHAGVAQIMFAVSVTIALVTSRGWIEGGHEGRDDGAPSLRTLTAVTVAAAYLQILVGALVRHTGAGLAIPDFPLAFGRLVPPLLSPLVLYDFAHRVGALVVSVLTVWTVGAVLRRHRHTAALARPALLLIALLGWQIFLGATIVWSARAVIPTTTHVVSGALILVTALVLALRVRRHLAPAARMVEARAPAGLEAAA